MRQEMVVTNQVRPPIFTAEAKQQSAIHHKQQDQERALDFGLSKQGLPISTRLENTIWYRGFFGSVAM